MTDSVILSAAEPEGSGRAAMGRIPPPGFFAAFAAQNDGGKQ